VIPIVGVIPPTKECGPILLTPYSAIVSLETVVSVVRFNAPPPLWTEATKLRMIVSLVSGLNFLHKHGIVHRELKPNDLIIQANGSLRISGYATNIFEEHQYTETSLLGNPSYRASELYDGKCLGRKVSNPKMDVFFVWINPS
jgi:serine/threonine protein kinase